MKVLNFISERYPHSPIDIFVYEPFSLDAELQHAMISEFTPGLSVPFISLQTLIDMKREAGRQIDLDDISQLLEIQRSRNEPQ